MKPEAQQDALAALDPAARVPAGPRVRLGVGAAVVLLIAALVTAVVVSLFGQQTRRSEVALGDPAMAVDQAPSADDAGGPATEASGAVIFVHILGAVRQPGLFELHDGARVMDAVAAAGGLAEGADPAGVNLARVVGDGEQLYVPRLGEAQPGAPPGASVGGAPAGGTAGMAGRPIDLNSATVAELDTLPRIGPALAQRIVDYREANGRFSSVADLRSVTGIGEKTFDGLKDLVRV